MNEDIDRRTEKRLRYNWPVWYAEDYDEILAQGQMVDISSSGAAFTCYADSCPAPGDHITTRFSVPHHDKDDLFDLESFIRDGSICRVDEISPYIRRVALQFAEALPFKPGEIEDIAIEDINRDDVSESGEKLRSIGT